VSADAARLEIRRSDAEGALVLRLVGDLDPHTAPALTEALEAADDSRPLVLDLEEIAFMDSAGLRVLLTAHEEATNAGRELTLRRPSEAAQRILELTGLVDHLKIDSA
jgi:anti-anti-sigma factor